MRCIDCGTNLFLGDNWLESAKCKGRYICQDCDNERRQNYYAENTKDCKASSEKCRKIRRTRTPIKARFADYKFKAKHKEHIFDLSFEEFKAIVVQPCIYCGKVPNVYNGIDRVDNSKGYTLENSVSCCGWCNKMKLTFSQKDFINKCKQITEKQKVIL